MGRGDGGRQKGNAPEAGETVMDSGGARSSAESVVPATVYLALIGYLLGSSVYIQMSRATQAGYALCFAAATMVPLALLLAGRKPPAHLLRVALAVIAVSSLYLIPAAVFPQGRSLLHIGIDFSTTVVPIGFLLCGSMVPQLFRRILEPRWVLLFVLALLYAPLIVQDATPVRSFEPPDTGVIALVSTLAVLRPHTLAREAAGAGTAALVVMALLSGSRSIVVITLLAFAVTVLSNWTARFLVVLGALLALVLFAVGPDIGWENLRANPTLRPILRISGLARPAEDVAISGRASEAGMVLDDIGRRHPLSALVGMGHGAVFKPDAWTQVQTISEEGFVHNVHTGPVLMLFRYGALGVALYLLVIAHTTVTCYRLFRRRAEPTTDSATFLYALGTLLFMIEFLARNVLPNPLFSFFLAGHLFMTLQPSVSSESSDPAAPTQPGSLIGS